MFKIYKLCDVYSDVYIKGTGGSIFNVLYGLNSSHYPYKSLMDKAGLIADSCDNFYFNYYSPSKLLSFREEKIMKELYNFDFENTSHSIPLPISTNWCNMFDMKYHNKYKRILEMIDVDYSPIENYDRYEDLNQRKNETGNHSNTGGGTNTGTETTVEQIEGFNSSSFSDSNKSTRTDNLSHTTTDSGSYVDSGQTIETNHIHGNIGVTTSDQMLSGFLDFWGNFNLLEMMCRDFDTIITTQTY